MLRQQQAVLSQLRSGRPSQVRSLPTGPAAVATHISWCPTWNPLALAVITGPHCEAEEGEDASDEEPGAADVPAEAEAFVKAQVQLLDSQSLEELGSTSAAGCQFSGRGWRPAFRLPPDQPGTAAPCCGRPCPAGVQPMQHSIIQE